MSPGSNLLEPAVGSVAAMPKNTANRRIAILEFDQNPHTAAMHMNKADSRHLIKH
jgi:hypothetical protein